MRPRSGADGDPLSTVGESLLAAMVEAIEPQPLTQDQATALAARVNNALDGMPLVETLRANEGDWHPLAPGVDMKLLLRDPTNGCCTFLARYAPGSRVPRHLHGTFEECMLVSGELEIAGIEMRPGDYQVVRPGARHGELYSRSGALVFARAVLRLPPDRRTATTV